MPCNRVTRHISYPLMTRFSVASHVFITRIYFTRYISQEKRSSTHMANLSILRNPAFESGLHSSPELFSSFSGGSFCPIFVSASICVWKSARVKTCHRQGPLRIFIFHLDDAIGHIDRIFNGLRSYSEYIIENCYIISKIYTIIFEMGNKKNILKSINSIFSNCYFSRHKFYII